MEYKCRVSCICLLGSRLLRRSLGLGAAEKIEILPHCQAFTIETPVARDLREICTQLQALSLDHWRSSGKKKNDCGVTRIVQGEGRAQQQPLLERQETGLMFPPQSLQRKESFKPQGEGHLGRGETHCSWR